MISSPYSLECMVPSNPWVPPKRHCLPVKAGSEPRLPRPAHPPSSGGISRLRAAQLSGSLTTAPPPSPGPAGPHGSSHPCILHPRSPQPLSSNNTEGLFSAQARTPAFPQVSGLKLWASSPWTPTPRLGDLGGDQECCLDQMVTQVTASSSKHNFSCPQTGSSPGVDG